MEEINTTKTSLARMPPMVLGPFGNGSKSFIQQGHRQREGRGLRQDVEDWEQRERHWRNFSTFPHGQKTLADSLVELLYYFRKEVVIQQPRPAFPEREFIWATGPLCS